MLGSGTFLLCLEPSRILVYTALDHTIIDTDISLERVLNPYNSICIHSVTSEVKVWDRFITRIGFDVSGMLFFSFS